MKNLEIFQFVLFVILLPAVCFSQESKSFFYYYNPDVVIQSAFIEEGTSIEYSFPDFATFSHLRVNIEKDSLYSFHLGIGLYALDAGISINPYKKNNLSLRFRLDAGSGIKSLIFMQLLSTISLKKNNSNEYGINLCASVNTGVPDIHRELIFMNTIDEYAENLMGGLYMKEEFYYIKSIKKLNFGLALGISHYIYRDIYIAGDEDIKFQIGFSISYNF